MFGNTSAWGNPQQQQQQQQQPQGTAFGQPSAFGSGSTFGTGAFGQNNQQQPAANPMFGNLGGTTATQPASSGFGSFGSTNNAFGTKPSTGFGAFGGNTGTSTFGGGGAFGSNTGTPGTGAFGQTTNTGSTFGSTGTTSGSGLFGSRPAATGAFGAPSVSSGTTDQTPSAPPVTTGSSNPPFSVFSEKDNTGSAPATVHYQSISMMPAYRGTSFEELRYQDYLQGRKTAGGGGFGQSAFGLNTSTTSNVFGQPSNSGAPTTTNPGTNAFGAFGTNTQNPGQTTGGFGAFGSNSTPQPATSGFGAFGQQQSQGGTTNAFGAFGQPQNQQPQGTTGLFGSGTFGTNANKPAFGAFGGGGGFGTGAFGQNTQQQQQQPATGTGLLGQNQPQQPAQTSGFGAFGNANNNNSLLKPSVFGNTSTTQPATGFGAFGQNTQNQQQQQQQQQPGTGLFGGGNSLFGQNPQQQGQQPQQGTGLFGQQQQQQPPAGGNVFGGGTSLFGNNQQPQKPGFGTGLFGQINTTNSAGQAGTQPAAGGLFSTTTAQPALGNTFNRPATSSIFGQSTAQPNNGGFGTSLFGNSLGGSTTGFGASNAGQGQGTLTASIAEPVSTNLPIFNILPPGPRAVSLDPPPKKPSSYFMDVPTRSPLAMSNGRSKLGASKLRGFGTSQTVNGTDRSGSPFSATLSFSTNNSGLPSSKPFDTKNLSGPDLLLNMSSLNGAKKISPKKLVLDRKIEPSELLAKANMRANSASPNVSFNPVLSAAAREREAADSPFTNRVTSSAGQKTATSDPKGKEKQTEGPQEGDYWVKPSLEVLRNMSNAELSSLKDLSVGRVGYGQVEFLDPVNLTTLPRLSELLGKVIQIEKKECCVYPDSIEGDDSKPPPGDGINVRARITLLGCWPLDKSSREPIKDEKNAAFSRHLKKLKNIKHTKFESYTIEDGKWVFTVEHF